MERTVFSQIIVLFRHRTSAHFTSTQHLNIISSCLVQFGHDHTPITPILCVPVGVAEVCFYPFRQCTRLTWDLLSCKNAPWGGKTCNFAICDLLISSLQEANGTRRVSEACLLDFSWTRLFTRCVFLHLHAFECSVQDCVLVETLLDISTCTCLDDT